MGETSHIGGETSSVGAKRPKLGQVVTATGAKRLEDGCETSWGGGGAKRLWCEMFWSPVYSDTISRFKNAIIYWDIRI